MSVFFVVTLDRLLEGRTYFVRHEEVLTMRNLFVGIWGRGQARAQFRRYARFGFCEEGAQVRIELECPRVALGGCARGCPRRGAFGGM